MRRLFMLTCLAAATTLLIIGQSCDQLRGGHLTVEQNFKQNGRACYPPPGVSGSPRTVEEVVQLINELPRPVSLSCFLEALDRPLKMYASQFSGCVQPSLGPENPRIFIFSHKLVMTVTPQGIGSTRLELSEMGPPGLGLSTKAEIEFPITGDLTREMPYTRIYVNNGTVCKICHQNETADTSVNFAAAFKSNALKPLAIGEVSLSGMEARYQSCDPLATPDRCLMLKMLFGAPYTRQDFPPGYQTP